MDFFTAVSQRYSHKETFSSEPVPIDVLEKIAQAGIAAPNGVNRQVVRLVILPTPESVQPIAHAAGHKRLETAPAAIAVLTDSSITPTDANNFEKEDYSAAVTQMLLAATALGYSSLWLDSPFFDQAKRDVTRDALNAPKHMHLWAVLPVGKPDGEGSRREKLPFSERVFYGRFGEPRI